MLRSTAKSRLTDQIEAIIKERPHAHPLRVLLDLIESPDTPKSLKAECCRIALPFVAPKLAVLEVTGAGGESLGQQNNLFVERLQVLSVLSEARGDSAKKKAALEQVQRLLTAPTEEVNDEPAA